MAVLSYRPPGYWDVANAVKSILDAQKTAIQDTLADESVLMTHGTIDIHLGHYKTIAHWPVVEIVGTTEERQWGAQPYIRDLRFPYRIFCGVQNIDRENKDHDVSILGACVTAVLDSRENKNFTFTVRGTTMSVYDSGIETVGLVTLNQGGLYALEISWFGRVWYQIPVA